MQKKNHFGLNKYQVLGLAFGAAATAAVAIGFLNSKNEVTAPATPMVGEIGPFRSFYLKDSTAAWQQGSAPNIPTDQTATAYCFSKQAIVFVGHNQINLDLKTGVAAVSRYENGQKVSDGGFASSAVADEVKLVCDAVRRDGDASIFIGKLVGKFGLNPGVSG